MKFLLVIDDKSGQGYWGDLIGRNLSREGGEVIRVATVAEAEKLLRDKRFEVREIITDTFAGGKGLEGQWRSLQRYAQERGMGISLATASRADKGLERDLTSQGVRIIQKDTFDLNNFLAERFPPGPKLEKR